jgi:hypothetical protein
VAFFLFKAPEDKGVKGGSSGVLMAFRRREGEDAVECAGETAVEVGVDLPACEEGCPGGEVGFSGLSFGGTLKRVCLSEDTEEALVGACLVGADLEEDLGASRAGCEFRLWMKACSPPSRRAKGESTKKPLLSLSFS